MKNVSQKVKSTHVSIEKLRQSQSCIIHLNKTLLTVRKINRLIVQERDRQKLLDKACNILVDTRGYRLVWVCAVKKTDNLVYPVSSAGPGIGYLKKLKSVLDKNKKGPLEKAIKLGRAITCSDISMDKNYKSWKMKAEKFCFISSAIAPIISGKKVFGTLNVHSDKKDFFDKEELMLLNEVAADIGLALKSIHDESQRCKVEEKLLFISKAIESTGEAIGISDAQGNHFYQNKAATDLFGYASAEEMQAAGGGAVTVKDPKIAKEMFGNIMSGKSWSGELEMITKSGRVFPAFERADAIKDVLGRVVGFIGVVNDLTKEKEIGREKIDFLSLVSHQLRTPLSAIKWSLELFMQNGVFNESQKQYLEDVYISNERLIHLVNSLLNVSHIQSGKMVVSKSRVMITGLMEQVEKICKPNAEKKNQIIKIAIKTKIRPTNIDPTLFRESLNNLIDNAIVYGLKGSQIDVTVKSNDGYYVIAVHNFGSAISKYERSRLFTKFYRGRSSESPDMIGSGLGLFLAKASIEVNGGSIWFKSIPKKGTTFFFTVPK